MTTTAQTIAAMFFDGQTFETKDGRGLVDVATKAGARKRYLDDNFRNCSGEMLALEFDDGSAIVVARQEAWDVRPEGCRGFCWADAGCLCCESGRVTGERCDRTGNDSRPVKILDEQHIGTAKTLHSARGLTIRLRVCDCCREQVEEIAEERLAAAGLAEEE